MGVAWNAMLPNGMQSACGWNGGLQVAEDTLARKCADLLMGRRKDA